MLKLFAIGMAIGGLISAFLLARATIWLGDDEQDEEQEEETDLDDTDE